jgi:hypothetical protein
VYTAQSGSELRYNNILAPRGIPPRKQGKR